MSNKNGHYGLPATTITTTSTDTDWNTYYGYSKPPIEAKERPLEFDLDVIVKMISKEMINMITGVWRCTNCKKVHGPGVDLCICCLKKTNANAEIYEVFATKIFSPPSSSSTSNGIINITNI